MFQQAAIDVAIALALMYAMLSLFCTIINEFIATKLKLRAKGLQNALAGLVDNEKLRDAFYQHGLIAASARLPAIGAQSTLGVVAGVARKVMRTQGSKTAAPAPSYLSGRAVALALIGSLDPEKAVPGVSDIRGAVENLPDSHIRDVLRSSLTEAGSDLDKLRTGLSTWFDDAMERLSGAYKRQMKWIAMLIGLLVAIAFNADSFKVATTIWTDQDSRAAVVAMASKVAEEGPAPTPDAVSAEQLHDAVNKVESALRPLPIGWTCSASASVSPSYWDCVKTNFWQVGLVQVLGWILTAAALSLGAPFWFDLLQKFVNIRGAGEKPKREDAKATA